MVTYVCQVTQSIGVASLHSQHQLNERTYDIVSALADDFRLGDQAFGLPLDGFVLICREITNNRLLTTAVAQTKQLKQFRESSSNLDLDLTVFEGLKVRSCLKKAYLNQAQYLMGVKLLATGACVSTIVNVGGSDYEDPVDLFW
jgi:hypothetical protein